MVICSKCNLASPEGSQTCAYMFNGCPGVANDLNPATKDQLDKLSRTAAPAWASRPERQNKFKGNGTDAGRHSGGRGVSFQRDNVVQPYSDTRRFQNVNVAATSQLALAGGAASWNPPTSQWVLGHDY